MSTSSYHDEGEKKISKLVVQSPLKKLNKTQTVVLTAMIFAAALVMSIVENMLPPLPIAVPGIKFGLSNIAVMYALFFLGARPAYMIAVLKAMFVFATRGLLASALSLAGGIMSLSVMLLLLIVFRERISYMSISIFGALFHNIGQFAVISLIYTGMNIWPYFPILMISGIIAGIVTSNLLRFILPAFQRLV
jgi:heptaprenyl diphosphate synthase